MILEHDGIVIDFFDTFPEDIKKVVLFLSGGADSALILYFLSQLDVEIYPINGYEVGIPELDSITAAQNVIEFVRQRNHAKNIHDLFVYPMNQAEKSKYYYMKPARKYFEQRYGIAHWIFGTSLGMPNDERPQIHEGSYAGEELIQKSKEWPDILTPWATVNKKFIAAQYDKFGLKELSDITNSCVVSTKEPCRKCWWCKERYWAFGSYDGGIQ